MVCVYLHCAVVRAAVKNIHQVVGNGAGCKVSLVILTPLTGTFSESLLHQ